MEAAIVRAGVRDCAEILALQRLCYQSEAALYGDYSIPPLTETLEDLRNRFAALRVLVARMDGAVIGSVRGLLTQSGCEVGRLMVDPRYQRRGLGGRLLLSVEEAFPEADRFELFTGHKSELNLRLYRRAGYCDYKRSTVSPDLDLIYLEKVRSEVAAG
jgi:ribosomal protein S18 acetylase RimI-like enzyme